MKYILQDGPEWHSLLPLTLMRAVSDIRIGMYTLKERWEMWLDQKSLIATQEYLSQKYVTKQKDVEYLIINPAYIPNEELIKCLLSLKKNECLIQGKNVIAKYKKRYKEKKKYLSIIPYPHALVHIKDPWDIFLKNDEIIKADFNHLIKNRENNFILHQSNFVFQEQDIFIEEGACIECATLNAKSGPIYIGKNVQIMEGAHLRGPLVLGEGAQVTMGAKIYGATTIGPFCKVGGEINNSVFFSYTNKSHEGFIGQSVIGEWCNIGAGTSNSNLKNNYSRIKVWNYQKQKYFLTKLQFCGLIMADHCRTAINTSLNTGTVCGIASQILSHGLSPKYIPSFYWGGGLQNVEIYNLEKAYQSIEKMMKRRNVNLSKTDKKILKNLFNITLEDQMIIQKEC